MSDVSDEDATRKLLPWNSSFSKLRRGKRRVAGAWIYAAEKSKLDLDVNAVVSSVYTF